MYCARKLMLLMLPGLVPLLVPGLQLEPTASSARRHLPPLVPSLQQPTEKRSVLLILAGLERRIEATWPGLERALVLPNEQAGYTFKVVFITNAELECHRESSKWDSRKCEEPTDREAHLHRIGEFFGDRNLTVLHDNSTCRGSRRLDLERLGGDDEFDVPLDEVDIDPAIGDGRGTRTVCAPWFERVHRVLAATVERGERFDRVVALRPDIVLRPIAGGAPQLLLDRMCAEKPGFSFVTPSWQVRGRSWLHDHDLDFIHILCPGEELPAYEEAIRVPLETCSRQPYPPLPPGFHSTKGWHGGALFCRFVQTFSSRNVSISHWDDSYTIDWPPLP